MVCKHCGELFESQYADAVYCSILCRDRAKRARQQSRRPPKPQHCIEQKIKKCPKCEIVSVVGPASRRRKYCSLKCYQQDLVSSKRKRERNLLSAAGVKAEERKAVRDYIYNDKVSRGCQRCPERRPSTLQYHHRDRSTKLASISEMVAQNQPLETVKAEIIKCDLLCANCHAVAEHGTGYRNEKIAA